MGTSNREDTAAEIERVFTLVGERAGDITPQVFERYFERSPAARRLMDHMDEHMLGRMMEQVLLLLMEHSDIELASYLEFETSAHVSYGVDADMYQQLMGAVVDVTAAALGEAFDDAGRRALEMRIDYLLNAIAEATEAGIASQRAAS